MKIPKKITPDRIRDSIVELRYRSEIPYEVLTGIFFQEIKDRFKYSNRPLGQQQFPIGVPTLPQEITLSFGGISLFHNDQIKIQIQPNSIIFNCVDQYRGWEHYKIEIFEALTSFHKCGIIAYSRIGIRYVSEYPHMDLADCVNFSFSFGLPSIKSDSYSFRSEFRIDHYKVILNLNNKLPIVMGSDKEIVPTSLVDLDVIEEKDDDDSLENIFNRLEQAHSKEKELFFQLLKESFLKSLNPEY